MRNLRLFIIATVCICALALGVFALTGNPKASITNQDDPPIIVKGGSLTVQCPGNDECLGRATSGRYSHSKRDGKINRIVVKATNGDVLFDSDKDNTQLGGRPEIEIYYK